MELEVKRAAEKLVEKVAEGDEWVLNMLELVVRCYDPCLSCATHLENVPEVYVEVFSRGKLVKRVHR